MQIKTCELLAYDCSIISQLFLLSHRYNINIPDLPLALKKTLTKLAALLSDAVAKEGTGCLEPVVNSLDAMVTFEEGLEDLACYQTMEIVRGCLPSKLIDTLLDLANRKVKLF